MFSNTKTRLTKLKAYLPLKILLNYNLGDTFVVAGKRIQNKQHKHKPTNRRKQLRTIKRSIMLQNILELLKLAKGETENIRIAQGKYELPSGLMSTGKKIKREAGWKK